MRVLFVTPYYRPAHLGGIERAIERLAGALRAGGHAAAVGVLTSHYAFPPRYVPGLPARERLGDWLEVYRLAAWPRHPAPLFPFYSCPVTVFFPRAIRAVLGSFRPDVIHLVGDGWVWAHLWLLHYRCPTTAVVFTPSFHDLTGSRAWLRLPNRLVVRDADRTVVLTEHEARGVQEAYRPSPARLATIPWGAALPPLPRAERDEVAWERRPVVVLCVGRLGDHKGQAWLLAAYARARPAFRYPTRLLFVGKDEGGAGGSAALAALIAAQGLEDEVTLAGEVDDATLERLYDEADLFALFSRYEAFGLVFIEAMAHAVPVLTHSVGANPAVLSRGAVLTAPFDATGAAAALARLVNDPAARLRLGAEAREAVKATFSWDVVAARYRRLYEAAVDERCGTGTAKSGQERDEERR